MKDTTQEKAKKQSQAKTTTRQKSGKKKAKRVPYHKKPDHLSARDWQTALRKQFAADNIFEIENRGEHPVYSDFTVYNPASQSTYKVAIRSSPKEMDEGENNNFCACYDFKTNQLGTCKHLEATLRKLWCNTRLRKHFQEKPERPYTSVYLNYLGERRVMIRVGTDRQEAMQALANRYFDEDGELKSRAFATFDQFLEKARATGADFRCYDDALEFVLGRRDHDRRRQRLKERINNLKDPYFETLLKTDLFPYQREGVYFAVRAGRSLIADEMGLGKTIQALGVAEMLKKEFSIRRVLIVCPTSLKYQWKSEIEKFTDSTAHVVEGGPLARPAQYHDPEHFYQIVSYHTVGNDLATINDSEPDLVILDEAQRIKNWQTKTSQNIKQLQSDYALVLTGTPLENKLEELYSLIQFINPFLLGSLFSFLQRYQVTDEKTGKVVGYQHLSEVSKRLQGVMLRRTKKKVMKQLPARQDKNLFVPMTEQQQAVHDEYREMVAKLVLKWQRLGFLPEKDRQRLMIGMNMMRMACNSTYVIDQQTRHDTKIDELFSILDRIVEAEGEKVVVFSQWERMTRLVAERLEAQGVGFQYLHGGVPSAKRKDLFTHFNKDPDCRVFLSTDAGGVGLNLQAASWMVNLDIPWNPAVLEQRIARIYRMGQRKRVSIINLVSTGTIEHRMLDVLRFKSGLAEGVLDQGEDAVFMKEDRFKQFMNSVESIVPGAGGEVAARMATVSDEDVREQQEMFGEERPPEVETTAAEPPPTNGQEAPPEEVPAPEPVMTTTASEPVPTADQIPTAAGPELMANGLKFFSQLAETLSDQDATAKLVESITERDEATGQTYLKVPVEDQKTVQGALTMLGTLFKALQ